MYHLSEPWDTRSEENSLRFTTPDAQTISSSRLILTRSLSVGIEVVIQTRPVPEVHDANERELVELFAALG